MVPCRTWFCVRKMESGCWTTISTLEMHPWVLIAYLGPVLKPTLFFWSWPFLLQVLPLRVVFVQLSSRVNSVTQWTAACQVSLSITNSQSLLKVVSIKLMMPSNHLIFCHPLLPSCLHSFPASGSFPMSQFFASAGQRIGVSASASVLYIYIYIHTHT